MAKKKKAALKRALAFSGAKERARNAKKKGAKKQSRKEVDSVLDSGPLRRKTTKAAPRTLKDQPLPGMANLKDRVLMALAGSVKDERTMQAESKAREAGHLQAAQKRMQVKSLEIFTGHGVEFVRVPGEEKFRCRLTGSGSTAAQETPETAPAADAGEEDLDLDDIVDEGGGVEDSGIPGSPDNPFGDDLVDK